MTINYEIYFDFRCQSVRKLIEKGSKFKLSLFLAILFGFPIFGLGLPTASPGSKLHSHFALIPLPKSL